MCLQAVSQWDDADITETPGIFRHLWGERMRKGDLWEREDEVDTHTKQAHLQTPKCPEAEAFWKVTTATQIHR